MDCPHYSGALTAMHARRVSERFKTPICVVCQCGVFMAGLVGTRVDFNPILNDQQRTDAQRQLARLYDLRIVALVDGARLRAYPRG